MKKISGFGLAIVMAGTLSVSAVARPAPPQATTGQVHELMQLMGTSHTMKLMMGQMSRQLSAVFEQSFPCVRSDYWNGFFSARAEQDMLDRLVPIYQKHFTKPEMAQLLRFYRSPLGRKVTHEMPRIMMDASRVGRQWGRARIEHMIARLKQNGTLNDEGKCPAPKKPSGK